MTEEKEKKKQSIPMTKIRFKGLQQNQKLTEEELEESYANYIIGFFRDAAWETKIDLKMKSYEESYDLDSLMPNDLAALKSLIQAEIRLDHYENLINKMTSDGVNAENIYVIDKLGKLCEGLRKGISDLQDVLKISRKVRKTEKEESVSTFLQDLKTKAKMFWEAKSLYIICPKCNNVLANVWLKNWESRTNKIILRCDNKTGDSICGNIVEISLKTLWDRKASSNLDGILPEGME